MGFLVALLVLAGCTAARADVPAEAVLAELPFLENDERNRIYLDLAPAGSARPRRLLLDTGSNVSLLTPGAAKEAGVRVRRTKSDPYRRKTVLGRDLLFFVDTRRTDTASRTGWEYGVLGGDFLAAYVVELDFEGRRVRFLDRDRYRVPESAGGGGEAVLPITVVSNRPAVRFEVNGRELEMLLDTGMPWALMLSGELARAAGVESAPDARLAMHSVMGPVEAEVGEAKRVTLGPFMFENVPVAVAPKGWFNLPPDAARRAVRRLAGDLRGGEGGCARVDGRRRAGAPGVRARRVRRRGRLPDRVGGVATEPHPSRTASTTSPSSSVASTWRRSSSPAGFATARWRTQT